MHAGAAWLRRRGRVEAPFIASQFPEQRAFCLDTSKTVAACCGRRSGKTYGLGGRLILSAERHPGEMSLYIAQTKNNSRMIVGRALMGLSRVHGLGLIMKEVDQRLMVLHPNGHHIWLAGAKHREAFEDFRGYKFAEVQVDEAQFHGMYLQECVEQILEPALGDLDGAIVVSGTPSPIPAGFFHAVTTGADNDGFGTAIPKWSTHHWTMAENTFFRGGKGWEYREDVAKRRGWGESHPTYLREYWGEWVQDSEALVYQYEAERNGVVKPNTDAMVKILGIDIGYEDSTAFVLCGYLRDQPEIYVLRSWKREHLIPSAIAAHIEQWKRTYRPAMVVADAGALGKGYVEEFNQRYGLRVEKAEKQNKMSYVEMLRGDMQSGILKIDPYQCTELLDELAVLQWNETRDGFDDRFADHAADALLYAWRACRTQYRPVEVGPEPGSPEWLNQQTVREREHRQREIDRRARSKKRRG